MRVPVHRRDAEDAEARREAIEGTRLVTTVVWHEFRSVDLASLDIVSAGLCVLCVSAVNELA